MGLESVVAREVERLGYTEQTVTNGRVEFVGDAAAIARANLWLRCADRVLVKLAEFPCTTFEELFENTRAVPWDEWMPATAFMHVNGRSHKSQLTSEPAVQRVVKKAIVERMKARYGLEVFPETGDRYIIEISLLKDVATLTLDTTGVGLHKRGYRKLAAPAPIKETLAAAMIALARWHPDRPLIDPMCGSGTIPIEAALLGLNIAPGLHREFAAQVWPAVPARVWEEARDEAYDLITDRPLEILGSDIDPAVLELAHHSARQAGLKQAVRFVQQPLRAVTSHLTYGSLITNPPYPGERLAEVEEAEAVYRELGQVARGLPTWGFYVITPSVNFERLFGRRAERKRKLYNGRIECHYYQFPGPRRLRPDGGAGEGGDAADA
jgi:putative N6-adenine-specific DNA methylase